jgi:SAM-dependent methyltransferase
MDRQAHWNAAYAAKAETQVSWFQERPVRSLAMIANAAPMGSVIDVGGGASRMVDALLDAGRDDVAVLDISQVALDRARARLAEKASRVQWLCADITQWKPARTWDVWHDRAVFHFLTDAGAQDAYISVLTAATRPGSIVIISTFALTGPERCSGLPVQRYSPAGLAARLGPGFMLEDEALEVHVTPWGATQDFAYAALRRA